MTGGEQRVTTGWLVYRDRQAAARKIDWVTVVLIEPGPRKRGLLFKKKPERISGSQLMDAPVRMRAAMAQAIVAIERLKKTRAWTEGWLGQLDLPGAAWEMGQRVLNGIELEAAIKGIEKVTDQTPSLGEARATLEALTVKVEQDANTFVATTDRAVALSQQLTEPARRAALERSRAAADQRLLDQQARLDAALLASTLGPNGDVAALSDAVKARVDAYDELL